MWVFLSQSTPMKHSFSVKITSMSLEKSAGQLMTLLSSYRDMWAIRPLRRILSPVLCGEQETLAVGLLRECAASSVACHWAWAGLARIEILAGKLGQASAHLQQVTGYFPLSFLLLSNSFFYLVYIFL